MAKVNKKEFINILSKKTQITIKECEVINNILEKHFLIGNKNKEKNINDLQKELNYKEEKARQIYETIIII